jgi:signal transduction histidine kinase
VVVSVSDGRDQIEVRIEDDGRGFDPERVGGGFGLTGMRERAMLAGGRLAIHSEAGGPTRITAVLPGPR